MRLALVTGSLVHGGAERHSITLVNRLAERGHDCHALYIKDDRSQLERLHGAASVHCLDARKYLDIAAVRGLAARLKALRPAAILAANPYALLYTTLARRLARLRAPIAVTFHTTIPASAKEWLKMLYYRPLFWNAERLVYVCEGQQRYWRARRLWGRSEAVIHNGVDPEYWSPRSEQERTTIRRVLGIGARDYVIGMCAVLRPEKNHLQLVEAIARLRAKGIAARALLIGDGPMRAAVEARARALGLAGAVQITGYQRDVRAPLAACDVVALCSDAVETFSLAALEAMALERPVVHSETGGAAEMIQPGENGYLFPVRDTAALVERLARLESPAARQAMGRAARATVQARFSEAAMVDRYENLLQELALTRSQREHLRTSATAH